MDDLFDLLVYYRLHALAIRFGILGVRKSNIPELVVHAEFGN